MIDVVDATEPKRSVAAGGGSTSRQKPVRSLTAMDIQPRTVEWLVPGLVPFGAITVLAGQPGLGKSLLSVRFAADFSAGRLDQQGHVLMLTAEDPVAEVVVPRLKAARAKLTAIHFGQRRSEGLSVPLQLPDDIDSLASLVREHYARLVVVDPLAAHLGGRIDSWKDQSIRAALAPLASLAEKHDVAVLVVAHLNKGQSSDPLQRLGGSIGLPAAARSVLLLGRDPDDPKGERGNQRVLAHVKNNFGRQAASLAYTIRDVRDIEGYPRLHTAEIVEGGSSRYEGSDLLRVLAAGELPEVTAEAVGFLHTVLSSGPRYVKEVETEATLAGLPMDTVRRAKRQAGVRARKERGVSNGAWLWELTPARSDQPAA